MKLNEKVFKELDKKFSINPHDAFVRSFLENISIARDFIVNYFPKQIVKNVDLNSLKVEPGSFIDDNMKEYRTDILYSVNFNKIIANIYLLIEHKSYIDEDVAFQIFRYMGKIWDKNSKNKEKKKRIIPFIFYYSNKDWNFKTNFFEHVEKEPKEADVCTPKFEIYFFNLYRLEQIIDNFEQNLNKCLAKFTNVNNLWFFKRSLKIVS